MYFYLLVESLRKEGSCTMHCQFRDSPFVYAHDGHHSNKLINKQERVNATSADYMQFWLYSFCYGSGRYIVYLERRCLCIHIDQSCMQ